MYSIVEISKFEALLCDRRDIRTDEIFYNIVDIVKMVIEGLPRNMTFLH